MKSRKRLRICILSETFYPEIGGLELYVSRLAQHLNEKGIDVSVITRKINPGLKSFEKIGNVSVRRISPRGVLKGKGWKAFFPILFLIGKVFFLLIRKVNQYDLLLVISFKVLSIPASIIKSVFGKRCIVVVVSPSELQEDILSDESLKRMNITRSSIIVKLLKAIRNPIIKNIDYFVGVSPEIHLQFSKMGIDQKKIITIPNGIDQVKFSPVSADKKLLLRKKLSIPANKITFCYTGRIVTSKGIMLLIEAWKEILKSYYNVYLLFVGSGKNSFDDCENKLNQFIDDNEIRENVFITGFVNNVDEYLKASDVFIFPSFYEGFGLAVVEALACELPAIVTRVGVASELITDYENGVSINVNKLQELLDAIEWVMENQNKWVLLGKNARMSVSRFTEEAETMSYIKLFQSIL